jgi:hypothetical protein
MPQYRGTFGETECRIVLSSERGHYVAQVACVCSGRLEPLRHANGDLVSIWATNADTAVSMVSAYLAARFGGRVALEAVAAVPSASTSLRASAQSVSAAIGQ